MKKYILVIISLLVVTGLVIPPYKTYTGTLFVRTENCYDSIWKDFEWLFDGRWENVSFLCLLFPCWFLWDLFNNHISRNRFFYLFQGVIIVCAGIFVFFDMSFGLFEADTVYFPNYYITPIWVLFFGFSSISLFSRKVREKVKSKLFKTN